MNDNDNEYAETESASAPDHDAEIAALKAEAAEMKDRMLRALADAENARKRGERERLDASQYAIAKFAR